METLDESTLETWKTATRPGLAQYVGVSILCHPDLRRIGTIARLFDLRQRGQLELNRVGPLFRDPAGKHPAPLGTARVSRLPLRLSANSDGRLRIEVAPGAEVWLNETRIDAERTLSPAELDAGALLRLGKYVLLRLRLFQTAVDTPTLSELIGSTPAMQRLRADILRVGDLDVPVLLRGETGVGKELVAAALHRVSARRSGPYVCVNMAAIPPSMAAAELFGHAKGAFTGAGSDRQGYFVDAHRGSLFLDEIGDTPTEVQTVLLRAIESGVIQPLGGGLRSVSVRLVTATDSDLEAAVTRGLFSGALMRRFGYELWVPPLRERIDDIPQLFAHFLTQELTSFGEQQRLEAPQHDRNPFLSADFVMRLMRHAWPGNVRELRTAARRYAIHNRGGHGIRVDERLAMMLAAPVAVEECEPPPPEAQRNIASLQNADILAALRTQRFEIDRTARELGVSRSWLHARMNVLPGVRKAKDLRADEIALALQRHDGDLERAAAELEVSAKGLRLQMARLRGSST